MFLLKELKVVNKQGKLNQHKETLDAPEFMKAKILSQFRCLIIHNLFEYFYKSYKYIQHICIYEMHISLNH